MEGAEFTGKNALVTGAGKGIGRATAIKLASLGAKVYGISRTESDLESLKQETPSIETTVLDITDWDATRKVVEKFGPIDLLVNNAGVIRHSHFLEVTKEDLDAQHNTNFRAAFNISQVVARGMVSRGVGGAIVNISSVAGLRSAPDRSGYCTSKAALDMLTKSLALELGPYKIRVNSVNPTIVMTELGKRGYRDPVKRAGALARIPSGRFAEVEDVVNAVLYLLSDRSSMINGALLPVDGGMIVSYS